jgi:hypothetical protein
MKCGNKECNSDVMCSPNPLIVLNGESYCNEMCKRSRELQNIRSEERAYYESHKGLWDKETKGVVDNNDGVSGS